MKGCESMKRLKEKLKDKQGMLSLEYAISFLIFIVLLAFTVDLAVVSVKRNQMTKFSQTVVRQIRTQNGFLKTMPKNFPGSEASYVTSTDIMNAFTKKLEALGLSTTDATMVIEGTSDTGHPRTYTFQPGKVMGASLKYQTPFKLTLKFKYKWGLFSSFLTDSEGMMTITSSGYTEYNEDLDVWEGE